MTKLTGLSQHQERVAICKACSLCEHRAAVILGRVTAKTPLLIVCEAPSRREELLGAYLPGKPGQLLHKFIADRTSYSITAAVLCRPPDNRTPTLCEASTCLTENFYKTVQLISPRVLLTLGSRANNLLWNTKNLPISIARKKNPQKHARFKLPIVATYHPAHILAHTQDTTLISSFKKDIDLVMRIIDGKQKQG